MKQAYPGSNGATAVNAARSRRFRWDIPFFVFALIAFVVSILTTGRAFFDIGGRFGLVQVALVTLVVQVALAFTSWVLGVEIMRSRARRELLPGWPLPSRFVQIVASLAFFPLLGVSLLFAFAFWYGGSRNLSEGANDARQFPNRFQIAVIAPLEKKVEEARLAGAGQVETLDAFKTWHTNFTSIVAFARGEGRQAAEAAAKAQKDENDRKQANEQQERVSREQARLTAANNKWAAEQRIASAEQRLEANRKQLVPFETELARLKPDLEKYTAELAIQQFGQGGNKPGIGPKYLAAKAAKEKAERAIRDVEAKAKPFRDRIEADDRAILAERKIVAQSTALLERQESNRSPDGGRDAEALPSAGSQDIDGLASAMDRAMNTFRARPSEDTYKSAEAACQNVLKQVRDNPAFAAKLGGANCEAPPLAQFLQSTPARSQARDSYERACSATEMTKASEEAISKIPAGASADHPGIRQSFDLINNKVIDCINLARAAGADVREAEATRSDEARIHSPDRDRFGIAIAGLFVNTWPRNFALFFALVFETLLLVLAIGHQYLKLEDYKRTREKPVRYPNVDASDSEDDPVPLAGAKAIKRYARYDDASHLSNLDFASDDMRNLPAAIRDNARQRADVFKQQRMAKGVKANVVALSEDAIAEIEAQIHFAQLQNPSPRTASARKDGAAVRPAPASVEPPQGIDFVGETRSAAAASDLEAPERRRPLRHRPPPLPVEPRAGEEAAAATETSRDTAAEKQAADANEKAPKPDAERKSGEQDAPRKSAMAGLKDLYPE